MNIFMVILLVVIAGHAYFKADRRKQVQSSFSTDIINDINIDIRNFECSIEFSYYIHFIIAQQVVDVLYSRCHH